MDELTKSNLWLFIQSEKNPALWTVGFYHPLGQWVPESDHESVRAAAERVHYLNGGTGEPGTLSGYSVDQIVAFLQKSYCLEIEDYSEFLTWVNDGTTPAPSYVEEKYTTLHKDPGMFLCRLDSERREKFMGWLLAR